MLDRSNQYVYVNLSLYYTSKKYINGSLYELSPYTRAELRTVRCTNFNAVTVSLSLRT